MSALDKPALQALIAPRSVDEFYTKYWPDKSGYFVSHGDPARLPAFLRSQELSSFDALAHANQGKVAFTNGAKSSSPGGIPYNTAFTSLPATKVTTGT